jgi:hypothetical protein
VKGMGRGRLRGVCVGRQLKKARKEAEDAERLAARRCKCARCVTCPRFKTSRKGGGTKCSTCSHNCGAKRARTAARELALVPAGAPPPTPLHPFAFSSTPGAPACAAQSARGPGSGIGSGGKVGPWSAPPDNRGPKGTWLPACQAL